jgi:hypothetical protein
VEELVKGADEFWGLSEPRLITAAGSGDGNGRVGQRQQVLHRGRSTPIYGTWQPRFQSCPGPASMSLMLGR